MIKIDDVIYNIPVIELARTAEFLDTSAKRSGNGVLKRKLLGVYYNYALSFGTGYDVEEYTRLYEKLTEAVEFHKVEVYHNNTVFTFQAYFASIKDNLLRRSNGNAYWTGLTVEFIAKEPAKRPVKEEE